MLEKLIITVLLLFTLQQFSDSEKHNDNKVKTDETLSEYEYLCKYPLPEQINISRDWGVVYITDEEPLSSVYLTKENLKYISGIPNIYEVRLENICFDEEGLEHFKQMDQLQILSFDSSNITEEGLKHLTKCKKISDVNLCDTFITRKGLKLLGELKSLKKVDLYKTRFLTDYDIYQFKRDNRNVSVHSD